uniref:Uncharacterized protein n=1 Tax=Arundo donax TaxID=35708 RepID=A0A0A8YL69_ARUDO
MNRIISKHNFCSMVLIAYMET